jgi:hypothetical protein
MLRRGTGWVNDGKRIRRGRAEVEEDWEGEEEYRRSRWRIRWLWWWWWHDDFWSGASVTPISPDHSCIYLSITFFSYFHTWITSFMQCTSPYGVAP